MSAEQDITDFCATTSIDILGPGESSYSGNYYISDDDLHTFTFIAEAGDVFGINVESESGLFGNDVDLAVAVWNDAWNGVTPYRISQTPSNIDIATEDFYLYSESGFSNNQNDPRKLIFMAPDSGSYAVTVQVDPNASGLLAGGDFNIEVQKNTYREPATKTIYINLNTEETHPSGVPGVIYEYDRYTFQHQWDDGTIWEKPGTAIEVTPEAPMWIDNVGITKIMINQRFGSNVYDEWGQEASEEYLNDVLIYGDSEIDGIITHLNRIFQGLNVQFVTDVENTTEYTTVNLGYRIVDDGIIASTGGIASRIDVGDQYQDNIFIDINSSLGDGLASKFDKSNRNIALLVAHEVGHELGLSHALNHDNNNIMSYSANRDAFCSDTYYYKSDVGAGGELIWGTQDAKTILGLTLGVNDDPPIDVVGNSFEEARLIGVDDDYTYNEYVGYGDAYDYYTFDVSNPGQFNIALTKLDSKVKLGLYVFDGAKYKRKKSASAKTDKVTGETAAVLEDILLDNGTYYLEVVSGDKGKGKCNTNYTLDITPDFLPPKSDDEFDFKTGTGTPEAIVLNAQDDATTSGWVGFGDPQDVYIFDVANAGFFNIDLTDLDARAGIAIYYEDDSKGSVTYKRAKSAGAKYDKITGETVASLGNLLLNSGTYYLEVISGDKGKGRYNTNYTLNIDGNTFPEATDDNYDFKDMLGDFNIIDLDNGGDGLASGWVGFGDSADVYCFTPDSSGLYDIALAGLTAKTNMSVWYFDEAKGCFKSISKANGSEKTGSALINDFNLTGGVNYYIAIESGDKGKGKCNSYYELNVDGTYIDFGGDFSNAPVDVGDFGEFAGKKRKSLIGNEWIGMADATDYYGFEIADYYYYKGQRYDFNDPVWVEMEFDISGDAVIEFSMLDKNGSVIDNTFVTDVNEKGTDGVLQLDWIYPGEYFLKVEAISGGAEYTMYGFGNDYEIADPPWLT